MRLPYKLSALLLALALLTGCTAQDRPLEVALVLKTTVETAEFWEQVMDGVYSAVDEFGVQLTVASPPSETAVEEQIAIMEETIQASPDVIILTSSDYDRLAPVTEAADAAGICVITMDSDVHSDVRKTFVASDNYQIGLELGRRMRDVLDAGQVAVLTHSTVASSGMDRAQGAVDAMASNPELEVVGVYDCENDGTKAKAIVSRLLDAYPALSGFVCTNEVCNLAVAAQLTALDLGGRVAVIGCDNSQQQIQYLEQNVIQAIVIQRPFNMGYTAVEQAVRAARGEPLPDFTEIACVAITQDNMYNFDNQKLLFPF